MGRGLAEAVRSINEGRVARRGPSRRQVLRPAIGYGYPMPVVGLHCSHEQIPPSQLLEHARHAEAAGFGAICPRTISRRGASDRASRASHGRGWARRWRRPGCRSAWSTRPASVITPAIVAQAATLCEMFPGRLWVALGTGEASNEHITGDPWPDKDTRNARLRECVDIMRALRRRDRVARRARSGRPGAAAHAAGLTAASDRTGHQRGHRPMGGRSGPTGWPRSTSRGPSWRR